MCPRAHNLLALNPGTPPPATVELTEYSKELRYFCQCCPYVYNIDRKVGGRWFCALC